MNSMLQYTLSAIVCYCITAVLEFLNNLWGIGTSRNRAVVPARQATQPVGIGSLESTLGLRKSLKIRALIKSSPLLHCELFLFLWILFL